MQYKAQILLILLISCSVPKQENNVTDQSTFLVEEYVKKVDLTYKPKMKVYAIYGDSSLFKEIENENWPEEGIIYSFNIARDSLDNIVYIFVSPFSESGDWDEFEEYYFDPMGDLVSYKHSKSFFNSECTDVLRQISEKTFVSGKIQTDSYKLLDTKYNPIDSSSCVFNYDYDNKIFMNTSEFIQSYKLDENKI